jgi:hypothetical protein
MSTMFFVNRTRGIVKTNFTFDGTESEVVSLITP